MAEVTERLRLTADTGTGKCAHVDLYGKWTGAAGLLGPVHWQAIHLPWGLEPELLNVSYQFLGTKNGNKNMPVYSSPNSFLLIYPTVANIGVPLRDEMSLTASEKSEGCQEALSCSRRGL